MSKRNKSKGRRINPTYWVFCEGKTEEAYVNYLRTKYRLPIVITCRVAGSNISQSFIKKSKQGRPTDPKDSDFLIHDGYVRTTMERLKKIDSLQLVVSYPSIELWFFVSLQKLTIRNQWRGMRKTTDKQKWNSI